MTKKAKRLLSMMMTLVVAFTMVFAMTITAFADGEETESGSDSSSTTTTYTLTINNTSKTAHDFKVFQIFTGDLSDDGVTLTNIEWGQDVTATGKEELGSAADYAKTINEDNAESVAQTLSKYLVSDRESIGTVTVEAGDTGAVSNLSAGYYFVKDADGFLTVENSAYTSYILEVVKNTEVEPKLDVPTVVKKVKDINDSTDTTASEWQDSADYDVNDTIPYQITGTLPSNFDKYETYYYQFSDTMSKGLTYTANTAVITDSNGNNITSYFTEAIATNSDRSVTVTWTSSNLKTKGLNLTKDSKIYVNYNCTLNENAVMGSAGNPNTVFLTYSNNPNSGKEGDRGHTPVDKNIVFTYNITVNKYADEVKEGNELTGAGFTLYKEVKKSDGTTSWVAVGDEVKGEALTTFVWNRVDDGNYKLVETTVPPTYNKMKDVVFTVSATHKTEADDPTLTDLTGDVTSGTATFTKATDFSGLSTDVINVKGSNLPSTGGIGTKIIYILGIILAIGAGVVLVTRKRVNRL